jgi:hypothetical protein
MRDDLKFLEEMKKAGWTPEFHYTDKIHKRTTTEKVPNHPVSFKKGPVRVWQAQKGWQVAELVDGYYRRHRGQPNLLTEPYKGPRFDNGFVPSLKDVLELDAIGEL